MIDYFCFVIAYLYLCSRNRKSLLYDIQATLTLTTIRL